MADCAAQDGQFYSVNAVHSHAVRMPIDAARGWLQDGVVLVRPAPEVRGRQQDTNFAGSDAGSFGFARTCLPLSVDFFADVAPLSSTVGLAGLPRAAGPSAAGDGRCPTDPLPLDRAPAPPLGMAGDFDCCQQMIGRGLAGAASLMLSTKSSPRLDAPTWESVQ